ncbi:TBC1 domain family member 7-like [Actinia tenebrosa]|uniref:TBC1 domain family member 7-like n=1 Tax=Actinia tenebrosa TaxID=6105 RepID=A0A6P8HD53_ACTTE|nr:TBC1 domain family member 7-like [Actinia tenebrosa]
MADGRNFRSFYYDTLGLKNVEQKKALEILLNSEEIDVSRVATFSSKFSLPAVYRSHVWKILLGITPPFQQAHSYVSQQRIEQYQDLYHALVTIKQIDTDDQENHAELVTKLFMMQEGLFRLINIPKSQQRKLDILHTVVNVFVDMFEDPVDLYWLSVKFVEIQENFISHWEKLVKMIQNCVQAEDNTLWEHINSFNGFEHLPYQSLVQWKAA